MILGRLEYLNAERQVITELRQKLAVKRGAVGDDTPGAWLVDPISKSHDFQFDLLKAMAPRIKEPKPKSDI